MTSPFASFSPFGHPRFSAGGGDPLAAYSFMLRLQCCAGFGVAPYAPLGLWKDTSMTIPATSDGDLVAAFADVLGASGLVALQSNSSLRPTLRFTGSIPWLEYGVGDYMAIPGVDLYALGLVNISSVFSAVNVGSTNSTHRLYSWNDGNSVNVFGLWHQYFGTDYLDQGDLTSNGRISGSVSSAGAWEVVSALITGSTGTVYRNGSSVLSGAMSSAMTTLTQDYLLFAGGPGDDKGDAGSSSHLVATTDLTSDRATIDAYLASIHP